MHKLERSVSIFSVTDDRDINWPFDTGLNKSLFDKVDTDERYHFSGHVPNNLVGNLETYIQAMWKTPYGKEKSHMGIRDVFTGP